MKPKTSNKDKSLSYASSGVNLDAAAETKKRIGKIASSTFRNNNVLSAIGLFGGLYQVQGYTQPVLTSSVDGVGTKIKIAAAMGKYDTVGIDLVNHCVNDILTLGASPLFFLDYIAMGKLVPKRVEEIVRGLALACREVGCSLIGGETAEMPGMYTGDDFDLVGFIVGAVEKDKIINGSKIKSGDLLIGLPSTGLHTNGYSLVRSIFPMSSALSLYKEELGSTLGEVLLETHRCYYSMLWPHLKLIKGIAHITGGGLPGNIPRVVPQGLTVHINSQSWVVPPVFRLIQEQGKVEKKEMYRVFNMGIGIVLIVAQADCHVLLSLLPEARVIGEIKRQVKGQDRLIIY